MKITIKDIAREAGVSVSTVSKVLSGKEGNIKISAATCEKVLKIAAAMHYMPDYGAQLIRTGRANTIGISIPSSKRHGFEINHYHSGLLKSIEQRAYAKGFDLLLVASDSCKRKLNATQIDGMIIIDQNEITDDIAYMVEHRNPFVIINNRIETPYEIPSVNVDNHEGMRQVVSHFLENGHQNIAFIGDLSPVPQKDHLIRRDSFVSLLEAAGIALDPEIILIGPRPDLLAEPPREYTHQSFGYCAMEHLHKNKAGRFTGIFCANDVIAIGALHYLYRNNIRVPDDLSVAGYDDVDYAMYLMPGLTSVYQPLDQIGKETVDILVDIIGDPASPRKITKIMTPRLVVRNSVRKLDG